MQDYQPIRREDLTTVANDPKLGDDWHLFMRFARGLMHAVGLTRSMSILGAHIKDSQGYYQDHFRTPSFEEVMVFEKRDTLDFYIGDVRSTEVQYETDLEYIPPETVSSYFTGSIFTNRNRGETRIETRFTHLIDLKRKRNFMPLVTSDCLPVRYHKGLIHESDLTELEAGSRIEGIIVATCLGKIVQHANRTYSMGLPYLREFAKTLGGKLA